MSNVYVFTHTSNEYGIDTQFDLYENEADAKEAWRNALAARFGIRSSEKGFLDRLTKKLVKKGFLAKSSEEPTEAQEASYASETDVTVCMESRGMLCLETWAVVEKPVKGVKPVFARKEWSEDDIKAIGAKSGYDITDVDIQLLKRGDLIESLQEHTDADTALILDAIEKAGIESVDIQEKETAAIGLKRPECRDCMCFYEEDNHCSYYGGPMDPRADANDCENFESSAGESLMLMYGEDGIDIPFVITGSCTLDNATAVKLVDILRRTDDGLKGDIDDLVPDGEAEDPSKWDIKNNW